MRRRIRTGWWVAGLGLALLAGLAVGGYLWLTSDRAVPVVVEDVVAEFRRTATTPLVTAPTSQEAPIVTAPTSPVSSSTSAPPTVDLPSAGVYVYDTVGREAVDALGGSEHAYPSATTITLTGTGQGCLQSRWEALEQRWDDALYCNGPDGWRLDSKTVFHSFFHQSETRAFTCDPGSIYLPAVLTPDATFTARCVSEGGSESGASTEDIGGRVIGDETLEVAGEQVETVHVQYEVIIGGETAGRADIDRWYSRALPTLLVREVRTGSTTSETVIGSVHYEEQYELILQSLEPLA